MHRNIVFRTKIRINKQFESVLKTNWNIGREISPLYVLFHRLFEVKHSPPRIIIQFNIFKVIFYVHMISRMKRPYKTTVSLIGFDFEFSHFKFNIKNCPVGYILKKFFNWNCLSKYWAFWHILGNYFLITTCITLTSLPG